MPSGRLCTIRLREQVPKTHGGCRFSRVNLATSEKFAFFFAFHKRLAGRRTCHLIQEKRLLAALNLALQGRTVSRPSESLAVSGSVSRLLRRSIPPRKSNAKRQALHNSSKGTSSQDSWGMPLLPSQSSHQRKVCIFFAFHKRLAGRRT